MRYVSLIGLLALTACGNAQSYYILGAVGPTGASGAPGVTGATGAQGVAGQDAEPCNVVSTAAGYSVTCPDGSAVSVATQTPVSSVQLCPGTPTYPTVFIEYALCIEGSLYGVYSANDGFLALLPPGAYLSDGIGSSCNFSIGPECTVTH